MMMLRSTVLISIQTFRSVTEGADSVGLISRGDFGRQMREDQEVPIQ